MDENAKNGAARSVRRVFRKRTGIRAWYGLLEPVRVGWNLHSPSPAPPTAVKQRNATARGSPKQRDTPFACVLGHYHHFQHHFKPNQHHHDALHKEQIKYVCSFVS